MKLLIEKLASGNAIYETPDVDISENQISAELQMGQSKKGEIHITGKNSLPVKGIVYSTDCHVTFENNQFNGVNNTVYYEINSDNLYEGQILSGTISIITTAGDYAIPFGITMKKTEIESTIGTISDLSDFVKLVQNSYDEALILFLSKTFKSYFLKDDSFAYTLYSQVVKNSNRDVALEEFLVGMNLKERVAISVEERLKEYMDITQNYSGIVEIHKNTWGHVDVDVSVEGDFLYNCKPEIAGQEFNGKVAEYQYYINANKLHGGSNHGRITFRTFNETIIYDIVIVNHKDSLEAYLNEKRSNIGLMKNYINFRIGAIDSDTWMEEMTKMADERLATDKEDVVGLLAKAQIAIVQNKSEAAVALLNQISQTLALNEEKSVEEYCYYLYLRTLYKNNPDFTNDIKEEIKQYYEDGHDTWQLLWMLFYMDERYEENPSLKYTMIKRMFSKGCISPVMYYEAAGIILKQPELLRVINQFEIQVLNFIGRYHIANEELAKQLSMLLSKERSFSRAYYQILTRFYEDTKSLDILGAICSMIINGNIIDRQYFSWLELGVENELKITNLYEYYVYSVDTDNYNPLNKSVYKYFSYGTETLVHNKDYFFANLIVNYIDDKELYSKFREDMERFVTQQILHGNNNRFLRIIYNEILTKDFIVDDMENHLSQIQHTHEVRVNNPNIRSVIVCHKEMQKIQKVSLENNVAYVQIYTEKPIIIFTDSKGRILSKQDYTLTQMKLDIKLSEGHTEDMMILNLVEDIRKNPLDHQGMISELKAAAELPGLSKQYEQSLIEFIVDYYYKGLDKGDLDTYLLSIDFERLSIPSRNKVMEVLISKNLTEMVYPQIIHYGYAGIRKELLEKLCLDMVKKEEYDANELLTQMCALVFRNGCRDDKILVYLGKYYQAGSLELMQLFLSIQAKNIPDNTLAERLLIQLIFEARTEDRIYDIYREYLKYPTSSVVRRAFYTYVTYNYFIKKVQCPDIVWEILEQEYADGFKTSLIAEIAFVEVLSKKETLTKRQIDISKKLIEDLAKNHVSFDFFKKFNRWFKVPIYLVDKTIIDFRTNPKHKVSITYRIKTAEGFTKQVTEEMGGIYQGIFTKEVIMFYGEEINYSITEFSDEFPEGKVVDNYSVRITDKNTYNDETRFGMINGMMIAKSLGRDEAVTEIMQTYELHREAGKDLFKLL